MYCTQRMDRGVSAVWFNVGDGRAVGQFNLTNVIECQMYNLICCPSYLVFAVTIE